MGLDNESTSIIIAIILLTAIIFFPFALSQNYEVFPEAFVFSLIIIGFAVISKKVMASLLDADIEHKVWHAGRYWFTPKSHLKKEAPFGIFVPVLTAFLTLGKLPFLAFLTYETRILKRRAAKRFGNYSFTEMTDWHNGLIGAAGIVSTLILVVISYILGYELLAKIAALYALANMFPISTLDGTQIFFGSRILWSTLAVITLIFFAYSIVLI